MSHAHTCMEHAFKFVPLQSENRFYYINRSHSIIILEHIMVRQPVKQGML